MAKTRAEKGKIIDEIKGKFSGAAGIVFTEFQGLNVDEMTALRGKFREANVFFKVYKNTFLEKVLSENPEIYDRIKNDLVNTTAVAISHEDAVMPAKVISTFVKENDTAKDKLKMKAAIVDGMYLDKESTIQLSKIPSKDVLLAKLLAGLNAPITSFVGVLSGVLRKFVGTLDAIAKEKEKN